MKFVPLCALQKQQNINFWRFYLVEDMILVIVSARLLLYDEHLPFDRIFFFPHL